MIRTLSLLLAFVAVIVISVAATLWWSQEESDELERISGYEVMARFDNVGHLKVGAPVSAGGVRVGQVEAIDYDFESYEAVVKMVIAHRYDRFPSDTSASILTTGFVGEQYIGLQPGAEERSLREGDVLDITSSALILEQIIGQFLYNMAQDDKGSQGVAGPAVSGPEF